LYIFMNVLISILVVQIDVYWKK